MLALTKIACPHCGAVLKSNKALRAGKQVQCVKCQAPFTVSPSDVADGGAGDSESPFSFSEAQAEPIQENGFLGDWSSTPAMAEPPRMGILESGPKRSDPLPNSVPAVTDPTPSPEFAPRVEMLANTFGPMPQALDADSPTAAVPRKRAGALLAACAIIALLVAGGITLAVFCFSGSAGNNEDQVANDPNTGDVLPSPRKKDGLEPKDVAPPDSLPGKDRPKAAVVKKDRPKRDVRDPLPDLPPDLPPPDRIVRLETPAHPEQKRINEAIDKGVAYLKAKQALNGGWLQNAGSHAVGFAALPGLTLLECGVKPSDEAVQKAAKFVRNPTNIENLESTYDLSLAILFLDRLGEARDRGLIQKLALRVVAGQTTAGGWSYQCRVLTSQQSQQLLTYLQQNRPRPLPNPIQKPGKDDLKNPLEKTGPNDLPNPLPGKEPSDLKNPLQPPGGDKSGPPGKTGDSQLIPNLPGKDVGEQPKKAKPAPPAPPRPAQKVPRPDFLPDPAKNPVAQGKGKGKRPRFENTRDDNSNSQFAMLALWAARRHDVPTESSLALAKKRYLTTQNDDGGWGYMIGAANQTRPAMTCVGLLGLAMGHGASEEAMRAAKADGKAPRLKDVDLKEQVAIEVGLRALGHFVGRPANTIPPSEDLYFLWSVERVAMLYNLKTIGNKDWYSWGVSILLPGQEQDGSWKSKPYPGHNNFMPMATVDTSFALLFLKRSNLVQDLTENLRLYMAITDPDAKK